MHYLNKNDKNDKKRKLDNSTIDNNNKNDEFDFKLPTEKVFSSLKLSKDDYSSFEFSCLIPSKISKHPISLLIGSRSKMQKYRNFNIY